MRASGEKGYRPDAGFSLVEMLIVIAITGLCATLAVPLMNVFGKPTVSSIGRHILVAAQTTRLAAVTSGKHMKLDLDIGEGIIASQAHVPPIKIPDGWSFSATVGMADASIYREGSIMFFPDGGSTGGRIILRHDGREVMVSVNWLTGLATLTEGRIK